MQPKEEHFYTCKSTLNTFVSILSSLSCGILLTNFQTPELAHPLRSLRNGFTIILMQGTVVKFE